MNANNNGNANNDIRNKPLGQNTYNQYTNPNQPYPYYNQGMPVGNNRLYRKDNKTYGIIKKNRVDYIVS